MAGHYFFKGVFSGQKGFWLLMAIVGSWILAVFDAFLPDFCYGYLFWVVVIGTFGGFIGYSIYRFYRYTDIQSKESVAERRAAVFEPMREAELRRLLQQNSTFATMCYECLHYDTDLMHCSRNLSDDPRKNRVRDVVINNRKYCLYWKSMTTGPWSQVPPEPPEGNSSQSPNVPATGSSGRRLY